MPNYNTPTPKQLSVVILKVLPERDEWKRSEIISEMKRLFSISRKDIIEDEYPSGYDRLPTYVTKSF